jgi:hypothetical protein
MSSVCTSVSKSEQLLDWVAAWIVASYHNVVLVLVLCIATAAVPVR